MEAIDTIISSIKFLNNKFKSGASYGTLNSFRSALSFISKDKVGDDPLICRFLTGVSKIRPQKPKYDLTWDVSIVLSYLEKLMPLEELSLLKLTLKTVTLLALSTAHRVQTYSLIKTENIEISENFIIIKVTESIKTSGPGKFQPVLKITFFKERRNICVASTLIRYINVTKGFRKNNSLFIATRPPYGAVTSQTISRWIKTVLKDSGIDVTKFSAHSTRHASTSAAFEKGLDINVIKNTAGWSESCQVFARFYNRPIVNDVTLFANTVLLKNKNDKNNKNNT